MSFTNLSVGRRLGLSFGVLMALLLALATTALLAQGRLDGATREIADSWMPSVDRVHRMNKALADFRVGEYKHILSNDPRGVATVERELADRRRTLESQQAAYVKLITSAEERALHDAFEADWRRYLAMHERVLELSRADRSDQARALMVGESKQLYDAVGGRLERLVEVNLGGAGAAATTARDIHRGALVLLAAVTLAALGAAAGLAFAVTRSITRQLGGEPSQVKAVAAAIADGDLTVDVTLRAGDAASVMAAMRTMRDRLAGLVEQVRASSDGIGTGSSQIAAGNADLSQRTEEQASNLQQTASSMEQLTAAVRTTAESTRQASSLADAASAAATRGGESVGEVITTMQAIAESARRIADITGVIDGIAFQTNILALNAAVEAARAGEQGRGFAVVAGEVRTLAQRAAQAAREIKGLIAESAGKVDAGTRMADAAGTSMGEIVQQVQRVSQLIAEVSATTQQQTAGIGQVGDAVQQLDQVTQQNAALVEESAAAAESLRLQAVKLAEVVQVFRLDDGPTVRVRATPQASARTVTAPTRSATGGRPATGTAANPAPRPAAATVPAGEDDWSSF